jgi:SAM-dependent methyltransferase
MTDYGFVQHQWDQNARAWASSLRAGHDLINENFGVPVFLESLGEIDGLEVLDAGCGEGRSSRQLAVRGARVTGIDISREMIAHALSQEAENPLGISYQVASCADRGQFHDRQFDLVSSFMAMMDMNDLDKALGEFHRIIRPGGRLAIMIRHPCHFTPGFSILKNRLDERSALTVSGYFGRLPYMERWQFPAQTEGAFDVPRFPYTLSDYVNGLLVNGFELASLSEPKPTDEMCSRLPLLKFWQLHAALYLEIIGIAR